MDNNEKSRRLHAALKKFFGYDKFRPGQEDIIMSISESHNTLVVMPTGGGKSLCYQIPAIVLKGMCIVISPLIALMKDQVDALTKNGVPAAFINSTQTEQEMLEVFDNAREGKYKLLYVAPERLQSRMFLNFLTDVNISFLAVDEAHCISEWGHDFRPAYMLIYNILDIYPQLPIIALTATATPEVQEDIISQLRMREVQKFIRGFDRPNLAYQAELCYDKPTRIAEIIHESPRGSHIVYCGSRKNVEHIYEALKSNKIKALQYHAGLPDAFRKQTQEAFIKGKNSVIVATNAFGMGIDKPNVRTVIHADLTATLESYYQEAGRAGRDGLPSKCYILYNPKDRLLQEFFIKCSFPPKEEIRKVYEYFRNSETELTLDGQNAGFDIIAAAKELQIPLAMVSAVVKMFEKNSVISVKSAPSYATIQFMASLEELEEYIDTLDELRAETLENLLRAIGSEAFGQPAMFDIAGFTRKYRVKRDDLIACLRSYVFAGMVEFTQTSRSEEVAMKQAEGLDETGINFEELYTRKNNAENKLETVENFVLTRECKRNYILKYFGETDTAEPCGKCSSCEEKYIRKPAKRKPVNSRDLKTLLQVVADHDGKFAKSVLADFLVGVYSKAILAFKMDEERYFGEFEKKGDEYVAQLLVEAYRNNYIYYGSDKYHKLHLDRAGAELIED